MSHNILVVNGHPDPRPERFCAALCDAYTSGAMASGCVTRRLDVGALKLPALSVEGATDSEAWESVEQAFRMVHAADRLTIVYPLWADGPPGELRQMFDYVSRLGAHLNPRATHLVSKAARVVVTTGLPAFLYRGKAKDEALSGITAGEPTFIGSVEAISSAQRLRWLEQMHGYGQAMS